MNNFGHLHTLARTRACKHTHLLTHVQYNDFKELFSISMHSSGGARGARGWFPRALAKRGRRTNEKSKNWPAVERKFIFNSGCSNTSRRHCMYLHPQTHTNTNLQIYDVHTHLHRPTYIHTYLNRHMHTYAHTNARNAHTDTHTLTFMCVWHRNTFRFNTCTTR